MAADRRKQGSFLGNQSQVTSFRETLSPARFARYLNAASGDETMAVELYAWNSKLSQSLYFPLQAWEIALRNRLNRFLCWKFGQSWPYERDRALRQMTRSEVRRLEEAIDRQRQKRKTHNVPTDAVVADLSAGFWVALLTKSYDVPFTWRYNLPRVFPHGGRLSRSDAATMCDSLLDLRNRIAHHEPIFHLALPDKRSELDVLLLAMCTGTYEFTAQSCDFASVWAEKPSVARN